LEEKGKEEKRLQKEGEFERN